MSNKKHRHQTGLRATQAEVQVSSKKTQRVKAGIAMTTIVLLGLVGIFWHNASQPEAHPVAETPVASTNRSVNSTTNLVHPSLAIADRTELKKRLINQLEEVDHTLCSYREATKYPLSSRPISEHPDQIYPNLAVTETHAMRLANGRTDATIQISSSQSRVYMSANESVHFILQAKDANHQTLPLSVTRSVASGLSFNNSRAASQVPVALADNGQDGDARANDGIASGIFSPANSGLAGFHGTIRVEVNYHVNGQAGALFFDVIYSPELPANWAGKIREANENGALVFYLPIEVRQAGRYILNARVDDAKGQPFALLNFNDLLVQGRQEIRMVIAGNLLRDQQASFPLTLRDIDGYLLKEDQDPDRLLLPRIEASVYKTKNYTLKSFSDTEPDTEERQRHLKEFTKDVALAKAALIAFDPEQARKPFPQSACSLKNTQSTHK
ncbi:MAG: choice-of-anchor X domain-containing protein [Candidatus Aquirickettsiella gammari]